jgi:hypothetical protein
MTGVELARIARRNWPHLRVLLATGYADLPNQEETDLPRLSKPYQQAQLQAEINKLLLLAGDWGPGDWTRSFTRRWPWWGMSELGQKQNRQAGVSTSASCHEQTLRTGRGQPALSVVKACALVPGVICATRRGRHGTRSAATSRPQQPHTCSEPARPSDAS